MTLIDRGLTWFWRRVEEATAPAVEGIAFLRILTGLFLMLLAPPYAYWVGRSPPSFFKPPALSVMSLLSGFPSPTVMRIADIVAFILGACVLLGVHARASTLLYVLVGILSSNAAMSFGKLDHDCMEWTFLGCMAFSGWGKDLALVPDEPSKLDQPARAFALLGVCLAFAMSAVGIHKALSWVDFDTSTNGFLGWFVHGYFVDNRRELLAPHVLSIPPLGLELVDYAGVVFETSCFAALLLGRRAWRFWIMAACLFHLTNTLTLNIPFLQNLLVYLAFVDFSGGRRWLGRWWNNRSARVAFAGVGIGFVLLHLALRRAGIGRWLFFVLDEVHDIRAVLWTSVVVWVLAFALVLADQLRRWSLPPRGLTGSDAARSHSPA